MWLKDIMTRDVIMAAPTHTAEDVAQMMLDVDVGFIPICESGRLVGVVTDRDLVTRVTAEGLDPKTTLAHSFMTPDPVVAWPNTPVSEAARIMAEYQIRRLPILEDGRLVGVVSLGDLAVDGGDDRLTAEALHQISEPAEPEIFPEETISPPETYGEA